LFPHVCVIPDYLQPMSVPCVESAYSSSFFFSSRRRHTTSVSAFLLNRSSDLTAPLPPETELSRQMTTSTTSIDIMGLQAAYANLHTDQERDYFMQRYHDVISSFGGKTSYDADNRPLLVMRS